MAGTRIVILPDPPVPAAAPPETSAELLRRLFGLTPAEARLAERLAAGDSLKEAAPRLGVTVNTARQRLKVVFAKTGVRRQAALVRLILTTPGWMRKTRETPDRTVAGLPPT